MLCTFNRPQELAACQRSLDAQTRQTFTRLLLTERGPLARLRNQGLRQVTAPVVCFIDDDVVCAPTWLSSLLRVFRESPAVVGVTGPAVIPADYRRNRDLFRYERIGRLYHTCFVSPEQRPGHLTVAGTFVPDPDYTYCGAVQFLEACNMAFRTEALNAIGGFDEAYGGVGDWSEPDVGFRLRQRYGNEALDFDPTVAVEHRCSRAGAYLLRVGEARQRLSNYHRFADRWVPATLRHRLYRGFLAVYYGWVRCRTCNFSTTMF